jgi:hypothetical protein
LYSRKRSEAVREIPRFQRARAREGEGLRGERPPAAALQRVRWQQRHGWGLSPEVPALTIQV